MSKQEVYQKKQYNTAYNCERQITLLWTLNQPLTHITCSLSLTGINIINKLDIHMEIDTGAAL